jgi:hypothetical protein
VVKEAASLAISAGRTPYDMVSSWCKHYARLLLCAHHVASDLHYSLHSVAAQAGIVAFKPLAVALSTRGSKVTLNIAILHYGRTVQQPMRRLHSALTLLMMVHMMLTLIWEVLHQVTWCTFAGSGVHALACTTVATMG